jgi:hypothetical protein
MASPPAPAHSSAGQPQGYPPSIAEPPPRKTRTVLYVVIVVMVIVVGGAYAAWVAYIAHGASSSGGRSPLATVVTVVSRGSVWQLNASSWEYAQFTLTATSGVWGEFTTTNFAAAYIFDPTDYQNFSSSGFPNSYTWGESFATVGSVGHILGAGSWYLVFWNTSPSETTSVLFTTDVNATTPWPPP